MFKIKENREIINLVLKEYQRVLSELTFMASQLNNSIYGCPPKSAIVKFHDKYNPDRLEIGSILSAWRITSEKIERIESNNVEAQHNPISGMYFNEGSFYFSRSKDMEKILFEWQVGPRYGKCYRYAVFFDDNIVRIEEEKILWVS